MTNNRSFAILTIANFILLLSLVLNPPRPVEASNADTVLRARGLEIVDAKGTVRASISIVPAGPARMPDGSISKDSKIYPETVRFRLIRPDGRPSVKITTSEEGSGLTLGGGVDPTYIVLDANEGSPSLSMINKQGHQQLIKP